MEEYKMEYGHNGFLLALLCTGLVLPSLGLSANASGRIVVAERGKTAECSIVLPSDPEPSRQYAAEELRDYVKQITGVVLPVVTNRPLACAVYLDRGGKELGDDAFRLCVQ